MSDNRTCINCRRELVEMNGVWLCRNCNAPETEQLQAILEQDGESENWIFIECPGATLYDPETNTRVMAESNVRVSGNDEV